MARRVVTVLALALAGCLVQASAHASGSISAGKGMNPRDAYTLGKALTFENSLEAGGSACEGKPLGTVSFSLTDTTNLALTYGSVVDAATRRCPM